jgi:RNA polymerase-binding protein DksA
MDVIEARQQLEQERRRLVEMLAALRADTEATEAETSSADRADRGRATSELETDVGLRGDLERQLTEINAALTRVDAGTYGLCESCGTGIPAERLSILPAARYCVAHQRAHEGR